MQLYTAEIIFQTLPPVVHKYYDIEASGVSLDALEIDEHETSRT